MPAPLITVCPSTLQPGHTTYSPEALAALFDGKPISHILPFDSPESPDSDGQEAVNNAGRLSLSGAQPKSGVILDSDSALRYSSKEEQSTYILKPKPTGYHIINHEACAANENLTMQLANQVYGIPTAKNGMCFFADGQSAYITRRFDINGGKKLAQEDFATLMGFTRNNAGSDYKYSRGSYEECGEIIKKHVNKDYVAEDLLTFFTLVLFNFLTLNDDAHLKNFSLLETADGYRLSPAYDLVNTSLQIRQPEIFALKNGLFKEGMVLCDTRPVRYSDFEEFGRRLGLESETVRREIGRLIEPNAKADELIDNSFLSTALKEKYKTSYHYRQGLLRTFR
jgi:toxin-antitoxin system, toxin component, hipA family